MMKHLSIFLVFVISGCTTVNVYQDPLSQLAEATQQTRSAVVLMSKKTNDLARKNLAMEAAKQSQRFGNQELAKVVTDDFVRFRSDGLALIELLTARLLSVISMDSGEQAAKSLENLGESAKRFAEARNSEIFNRYSIPIAKLAATVTRVYDLHIRESILKDGIEQGIPPSRAILEEIKRDFAPGSPTNVTMAFVEELQLKKNESIDSYNLILKNEQKLTQTEKQNPDRIAARYAAILDIIAAEEALSAVQGREVNDALNALERSLDKLETAAASGFESGDLARATQEIQEFSRRAWELTLAVRSVYEAKN